MKSLIITALLLSSNLFALTEVNLNSSITNSVQMSFETHIGAPDSFQNALALNIEYKQIGTLRDIIKHKTGKTLKFLTAWKKEGEAHVTTISPPEFKNVLRNHISMKKINEIATKLDIQSADLKILGIGSGKIEMDGKIEETFFIIVDSSKLREIRHAIHQEFIAGGGHPDLFDPTWFFPHITIGYTKKDIHENSGLLKNIKYSFDKRFKVNLSRQKSQ